MDKETGIIKHILTHCKNILQAKKRFGDNFAVFNADIDYFNSVGMSLLQIGELANHLSDEFLTAHKDVPWKQVIGLRNRVVHGYGMLDKEVIWETVNSDIPVLQQKCKELVGRS
jgi:uncharacterized protein with HEPN domain